MPTCLAISAGLTPASRSSRTLSALALAVGARLTETVCNRQQTGIHRLILLVIGVFILMYLGLGFVRPARSPSPFVASSAAIASSTGR